MPNKIYLNKESGRTWSDAVTAEDELMDMGGLAASSIACGSYHDLGANARSRWYEWKLHIDGFDAAPAVGETINVYIMQSDDGTNFDGPPTTAPTDTVEGTVGSGQLVNLKYAGSVVVTSTTATDKAVARGIIEISGRYIAPVVQNKTGVALLGTSDAHVFTLTPIPDEVQ